MSMGTAVMQYVYCNNVLGVLIPCVIYQLHTLLVSITIWLAIAPEKVFKLSDHEPGTGLKFRPSLAFAGFEPLACQAQSYVRLGKEGLMLKTE